MQNLAKKGGDDSQYLLSLYKPSGGEPQVFIEENSIYMVMEKCKYDLIGWRENLYINDDGRVPADDRMAILEQLARALNHMHMHDETKNIPAVIHADVKLENIFVVQDRSDPGGLKIKLADFGFSSYLTADTNEGVLNAGMSFRRIGTPGYLAPELFKTGIVKASDMYCAGVCHAHLLGNIHQYNQINELFVKKIDCKGVETKGGMLEPFRLQTRDCSDEEWDLLLNQLSEDQNKRYTAAQVLDLKFITA